MRATLLISIAALVFAAPISGYAIDTHSIKVESIRQSLVDKAQTVLSGAEEIDKELERYKWKSKATQQARIVVTNMLMSSAWRNLPSRDTRKHNDAVETLQRLVDEANRYLETGRKELLAFKEAEYQAWAKAHPEEARTLELQKALRAAQSAAFNAEMQAQEAKTAARQAGEEAEEAKQQAQDAQNQAQRAQRQSQDAGNRATRAEDALFRQGINSW